KAAQLWNVSTGEKVELKHASDVNSAAFSPDGEQIITASADGVARIWKTNEGERPAKTLAHPEAVRDAIFSPNGEFIATMGLNHVWLWNPDGGKLVSRPLEQSQPLTCIKFSPDSQCLLSGSDSGKAQLWAVQSGEAEGEAIRERSQIVSL